MTTNHAPGPYRAISYGKTIRIDSKDELGIAWVNPFDDTDKGIPSAQDRAQANLFAASAELLEACEMAEQSLIGLHARNLYNEHPSYDSEKARKVASEDNPMPIVLKLRAAIAKAKGEKR